MRTVKLCEAEYDRAFYRWYYTPKWRMLRRYARWLEWRLWLRGLFSEVAAEAERKSSAP